MPSRDHPPLQRLREQVRGYLVSRGFRRTLEGWRNGRWLGRVQPRRWRLLGRCLAAGRVGLLTRARACHEGTAPAFQDRITKTQPRSGARARPPCLPKALMSFPAPIALLDRDADLDPPRWREHSPGQALLDTLGRRKPRQPTGTSLPPFRHNLAQAWRLMPASQIDEALRMAGSSALSCSSTMCRPRAHGGCVVRRSYFVRLDLPFRTIA